MSKTIYVGQVEHKHGVNTYSAETYDDLVKKVALEYVTDWIGDVDDEDTVKEIQKNLETEDYDNAVTNYFNHTSEQGTEFWDYNQSEL